ncbi:MAG: histidine kinase [Chloroflexi bacterium]|nr:histidine kinase [Chloroflexota bacterium]
MIWLVSTILFLFTFLGVVIAAAMLKDYKTSQGRQLGLILISTSVASLAYGMEILSPGLYHKFAWVVVRIVALTVFTLSNSAFVFQFTNFPIQVRSWKFLIICLIPGVILFFLASYPLTHLVYDQIWLDPGSPIPVIQRTVGPLYWVLNIYNTLLLYILIYLVLKPMSQESKLNRNQSLIVAGALSLIVVTHLMHLGEVRLLGALNPNLFSYFPAAALILFGVKRYGLADIRPIARTLLFEQMQDGILVVDQPGNLIDLNPAAKKYLNIDHTEWIGKPLMTVAGDLARMFSDPADPKSASSVIRVNDTPLQMTVNQLLLPRGEKGGYLIILRDISDRESAEKLRETEIRHQVAWDERKKIARSLHDSINQYLNSLVLLSGSARQRLDHAKYDQLGVVITHIADGARQASQEIRTLIRELQLESASEVRFDLVTTIRDRLNFIGKQTDLKIQFEAPDSLELDPEQQREIFYILIEALNNILQHAGASAISVRLRHSDGRFSAEISDNGCGFDPGQVRAEGMGMANIKERSKHLGADLSIVSSPGRGTRLLLLLPGSTTFDFKRADS